jgi:hypothetical protein
MKSSKAHEASITSRLRDAMGIGLDKDLYPEVRAHLGLPKEHTPTSV